MSLKKLIISIEFSGYKFWKSGRVLDIKKTGCEINSNEKSKSIIYNLHRYLCNLTWKHLNVLTYNHTVKIVTYSWLFQIYWCFASSYFSRDRHFLLGDAICWHIGLHTIIGCCLLHYTLPYTTYESNDGFRDSGGQFYARVPPASKPDKTPITQWCAATGSAMLYFAKFR